MKTELPEFTMQYPPHISNKLRNTIDSIYRDYENMKLFFALYCVLLILVISPIACLIGMVIGIPAVGTLVAVIISYAYSFAMTNFVLPAFMSNNY